MEDGCPCFPCAQCVRTKQVAVVEDLGNFEQLLGKLMNTVNPVVVCCRVC